MRWPARHEPCERSLKLGALSSTTIGASWDSRGVTATVLIHVATTSIAVHPVSGRIGQLSRGRNYCGVLRKKKEAAVEESENFDWTSAWRNVAVMCAKWSCNLKHAGYLLKLPNSHIIYFDLTTQTNCCRRGDKTWSLPRLHRGGGRLKSKIDQVERKWKGRTIQNSKNIQDDV